MLIDGAECDNKKAAFCYTRFETDRSLCENVDFWNLDAHMADAHCRFLPMLNWNDRNAVQLLNEVLLAAEYLVS